LFDIDNINIKIYNNFLLESKKNNELTNYNYNHLTININNSVPSVNTINNFFINNSNKNIKINNDYLIIEYGIFFNSISSFHHSVEHLIYDFMQHINIFYDILILNKDYNIILEIIPFQKYNNNFDIYNNINVNYDTLDKFINFVRKIGLKNEIKIISPLSNYQNFNNNFIFVKNLYTIEFKEFDNINYLPLISRLTKNLNNNYISTTLINIINQNNNNKNIHYEYHKKRFFILEKPYDLNNIDEDLYFGILNKCKLYCNKNNLKLIIYDNDFVNREDIYEKYSIASNTDIIIGFTQTFFLYNFTISNGKILILNYEENYKENNELLDNLVFYNYYQLFQNNNNNVILNYYNNSDYNIKLIDIIDNFLL
jgi:hypothetical protein